MDYEKAAMNSVQEIFIGANLHGCFYHLAQSIYRRIQVTGLQQCYQEDPEFALTFRIIPALAFVPLPNLIKVFENLQDLASHDAQEIMDYFEDTYIGRKIR